MQKQVKELDYNGQKIYVGIDAHLKKWTITVQMENLFQKTFSQDPSPAALYQYLSKNFPGADYFSAYEAGFSGFWTHYRLKELGVNSIVVNPADIPTTAKEKVQKEDARDSRKIARSLKNGELVPIHVPSHCALEHRSLLRVRKALVKDMTRTKNRIKSFLNFNGLSTPDNIKNDKWTRKFLAWLLELQLEKGCRHTLDAHLASYHQVRGNILNVLRHIRTLSKTEEYEQNVKLLISIPGIALVTAMLILTELETMDRFSSLDRLCSFIGLVPSTNSSGENERTGNISPRGHTVLRTALIESAWVAARYDPALARSYSHYCKRMDANKAIIRIAKKLLGRIKYVLKNKQTYVPGVIK